MKSSPRQQPAFTLIELIICVCIIAILSVALLVNFSGNVTRARLDDQVVEIVHLLEQARSYSLTNFLIDDITPAEYYLVTVNATGITLDAQGATATDVETLESVTLSSNFSITNITGSEYFYYFPPSGEICFDTEACDSGINDVSFTVVDSTAVYSQEITLNKFGGAPEVEQ